jgi:hypothetical protein
VIISDSRGNDWWKKFDVKNYRETVPFNNLIAQRKKNSSVMFHDYHKAFFDI